MTDMRLNRYLATCGVASRRKCDALIQQGLVEVNGRVEDRLGVKIDVERDRVSVEGRPVRPAERFTYILLHKPRGFVSTASDDRNRKTVVELVPIEARLFPVGRLDLDSTGLVLLTNDGDLTYRLTHPKFEVEKVYAVRLNKPLSAGDQRRFESGVVLEEGRTAPCEVRFPELEDRTRVTVTLRQGWNRQIRRMFAALGYSVISLKRIRMGGLALDDLPVGGWRKLTPEEVWYIKHMAGLAWK